VTIIHFFLHGEICQKQIGVISDNHQERTLQRPDCTVAVIAGVIMPPIDAPCYEIIGGLIIMNDTLYPAGYWQLVLDLECPLCSKFAGFIRHFDKETIFKVTDVPQFDSALRDLTSEKLKSDMHIFGKNGEFFFGAEALQMVISLIPPMRPFRWMIETGFGRKAADLAYLTMKRLRSCGSCGKKRFE